MFIGYVVMFRCVSVSRDQHENIFGAGISLVEILISGVCFDVQFLKEQA